MNLLEQLDLPDLDEHLVQVEVALTRAVESDDQFLTEVAGHLTRAGGKRLRPMLALAAASASGAGVDDDVIQGAVSVELVHLGSLYHDDVMDAAEVRRGVASVNARWGNVVAILVGDYLLARASELAAALGAEVARLLGATIGQLCTGEVKQLTSAFDTERSEAEYLASVEGKTAALLATSARIGSLVSGADRQAVEAMTEFGRCFGMAFQIWDDVCDLTSTSDALGKPAGHDLIEGTYTLPVIRALALRLPGEELRSLLGAPVDSATATRARDIVMATDAVPESILLARHYAERAASALEGVDAGAQSALIPSMARLAHHLLDSVEFA